MKYVIIDNKNGDLFSTEHETKEQALACAEEKWSHLTEKEKKDRESFFVLESENPDEEAENHFDGDVIKKYK